MLIGEVTMLGSVCVLPYASVHAAGIVLLKDGQRLDLGAGAVGDQSLSSADLE